MSKEKLCKIHPKYRGERKPTSKKEGCTCMTVWMSKQKKSKMPDLDFKKTEFDGWRDIKQGKRFYTDIRELLQKLLLLPLVRNRTQREEMLRGYMFSLKARDRSKLPYDSGGIGTTTENDKFKALMAEVSCLVVAYWTWLDEPTDSNLEVITDHAEYLDHILLDPGTLKVTELPHGHGKSGSCRWRITNDRIMNGFKMLEH